MPCVRQPCGNSVERDAKPMQMKCALSEVRAVICLGGIPKKELLWRRLENRHRGRLGNVPLPCKTGRRFSLCLMEYFPIQNVKQKKTIGKWQRPTPSPYTAVALDVPAVGAF